MRLTNGFTVVFTGSIGNSICCYFRWRERSGKRLRNIADDVGLKGLPPDALSLLYIFAIFE